MRWVLLLLLAAGAPAAEAAGGLGASAGQAYSSEEMTHWAFLAWHEMFGRPSAAPPDGVQAFLAICDGKIYDPKQRMDQTPMGRVER